MDILIPIAFFASIFGIVYVIISARSRERMALIEKGMDATTVESYDHDIFQKNRMSNGRNTALMFGILLIGLSIGLIVGSVVDNMDLMKGPLPYFSMVLLFGGISLLIYYMILNRKKEREEKIV